MSKKWKGICCCLAITIICTVVLATTVDEPKCTACKEVIKKGDFLAAVQGEKGIYHVHFRCALKKHLRTYSKK